MKRDRTDDFMDLTGIISELRGMDARITAIILQLERSAPVANEPGTGPHSFSGMQSQRAQTSATPGPGIRNPSRCRRVRQ